MKKTQIVIIVLSLILTSCTVVTWHDLKIKEVNNFKENLMKNNKYIEGIKFNYAISQLNILVKLNKEPMVQDVFKTFHSIRTLLVNEDFKKEFLKEYSKIDKNTMTYPNVTISFDFPNEEGINLEFDSKYYNDREKSKEKKIKGCETWMINNLSRYDIKLPVEFTQEDYESFLDNRDKLEKVK
ncbi:hypothetical protein [Sporosalibacterium faouarense]|uniref:hypothetical protein n=1 Tax=Sporosalibacterium faouarense TaxID=516123 RepID=UPI00141C389F|nr:hypothetical protein [Sporosalibacterium faouarense]MTI46858.1 hypothetical protein [Bacillota bacterium]